MQQYQADINLTLPPSSCFLGALALLVLPIDWVFAWVIAAAFHELCHIVAVRICGYSIRSIIVGIFGAVIEAEPMPWSAELLCTVSGPMGGLIFVLLARWVPKVAVCACVQTMYNLLPVYPLDGGRALRCILNCCTKEASGPFIEAVIRNTTLAVIAALGILGTFRLRLGPIPAICAVIFLLRNIKFPCKQARLRVQ